MGTSGFFMRTANTLGSCEDVKAGFEPCAVHMDLKDFYAESEHDKTSKITCAPRENSAKPVHQRRLISFQSDTWLSIECTTETGQTW